MQGNNESSTDLRTGQLICSFVLLLVGGLMLYDSSNYMAIVLHQVGFWTGIYPIAILMIKHIDKKNPDMFRQIEMKWGREIKIKYIPSYELLLLSITYFSVSVIYIFFIA